METSDVALTDFRGSWKIDSENAGVSAMHVQLMPNNKAVWFDSTSNGLSEIQNNPPLCKPRFGGRDTDPPEDCTAHGVEYDIETAEVRPLKVGSSPWCSCGGLGQNGNLVSTGGDKDGFRAVRNLHPCPNCDLEENPRALFANRWYATQHTLEDGSFIVMGGRNAFNYEIIPSDSLQFTPRMQELPLLEDTTDDGGRENNLYPFVNLLPDGNLFVFANYKSIVLNPNTGETIRSLPDLPGGSRNYPASGMSALLPINLDTNENSVPELEVLICGGNTHEAYTFSDLQLPKRTFLPALQDCGKLNLDREDAEWENRRDAFKACDGGHAASTHWRYANDQRSTGGYFGLGCCRHSQSHSSSLQPQQKERRTVPGVGSNTNAFYKMEKYNDDFRFPTEVRVEKFSPPYLDQALDKYRIEILEEESDKKLKYGGEFNVAIGHTEGNVEQSNIKVTMYSPPFTTHGYSMNQRLLILKVKEVAKELVSVVAPPSAALAPPGYYLLFVVHSGVPSHGMWVHITQ
ncbi:putative aldehyde oxidase Art an 7 [Sesamum angolense]|uniref:Aldehyde oxidase Art an 7 n=1 Tax=Sesamum angolense TaxID=2727404 RepID=A0AAE1WE37_9LAMI|nr:putative aldehyde oxidase Art an 7 [Sesamum angolense]